MRSVGCAGAARRYFGKDRRRSSGDFGEGSSRDDGHRSGPPGRRAHTGRMRIVSLVPSATETLFALGLGGEVVAVTHECDHPEAALALPNVTRDVIGPGLAPDEI